MKVIFLNGISSLSNPFSICLRQWRLVDRYLFLSAPCPSKDRESKNKGLEEVLIPIRPQARDASSELCLMESVTGRSAAANRRQQCIIPGAERTVSGSTHLGGAEIYIPDRRLAMRTFTKTLRKV
jgi:hypothetical protein